MRVAIIGNSGSGKSTFARELATAFTERNPSLSTPACLDLDTIAWLPSKPPQRRPHEQSRIPLARFVNESPRWIIEGCYADLVYLVESEIETLVWLHLPTETCLANCRQRPWEPHKFSTRQEQEEALAFLLEWVRSYPSRDDAMSERAHRALFLGFERRKLEIITDASRVDTIEMLCGETRD